MALQHFPRATDDWAALLAAQKMWAAWNTAFRTAHTAQLWLEASTGNTLPFGNAVIFGNASAVTTQGPPKGIETALNNLVLVATNNNTTINVLVDLNKQMAALLVAISAEMDTSAQPECIQPQAL